ncbi:cation transporter [Bacteriovorax sp. PP10]|uniref:Cation transporter n=1 Tax=Bacteriovorax antarcticus TaxID=3088717 RepID=A0ABU5VYS1_9BACT|nr:cation transporter [Bacteriovorax sp. PP10]MEA9357155.1 cation transporter [Bacteriovorax sp. PP10]
MKTLLMVLALTLTTTAFAAEKIEITVKGMVCSFCSQGITKKFNEEKVKSVNVDLGKHLVTLELNEGQKLSSERITEILTDSGYGVEKIEIK